MVGKQCNNTVNLIITLGTINTGNDDYRCHYYCNGLRQFSIVFNRLGLMINTVNN